MGKTCCGKSVVKILKLIKHPMFCFECVILFIHITKQSPVKFFSAPKRRKGVVKILKLIKHLMSCFEYIILFILITKQSSVNFLVHKNGESAKSKWSLFGQNVATCQNNVSPLFPEPNIYCFFFCWLYCFWKVLICIEFGQKVSLGNAFPELEPSPLTTNGSAQYVDHFSTPWTL